MLVVDKQTYDRRDVLSRFRQMESMPELRRPQEKLFAVCLEHPFDIFCWLQYVRDREGSILLLYGQLPMEAAVEAAVKARCNVLVYGRWDQAMPIGMAHRHPRPSLYQYSSGTTGEPKLIARAWEEVDREVESYNRRLASSDPPIILVPVSHSYGLIAGVLAGIRRGAEPIIVHDRNPKFAMHVIQSNGQSVVYGVPFLYHLLHTLSKGRLRYRRTISSGAPLSEALLSRLRESADEVWQQYGCTEAGCISLGCALSDFTDVGRPLDHIEVTARAEPGVEGPNASEPGTGESAAGWPGVGKPDTGESAAGWPGVGKPGTGWPNASEPGMGERAAITQAEAAAAAADAASPPPAREIVVSTGSATIYTRDIGYVSEAGRVHVLGRADDLINVSGLKVIPSEVESVIGRMRGVKEAVVYRTGHKVWGEAVKALVVAANAVGREDVRAWCQDRLPAYKVPSVIEIVKEIPRLPSGKISRKLLMEQERMM